MIQVLVEAISGDQSLDLLHIVDIKDEGEHLESWSNLSRSIHILIRIIVVLFWDLYFSY